MIRTPPFAVTTDPDAQEAESLRYSAQAFMILPLKSGRVAVLGHMRDLHCIVDTLAEAVEAASTIPFLVYMRREEARKATPRPVPKLDVELDLDF